MSRRRRVDALLVAWIAGQLALPLLVGLDFANGRYFSGPFTWGMYSHKRIRAEVSVWVVDEEGRRVDVPGRGRLHPGIAGATPERVSFAYPKEGHVERHTARLVDGIAALRRDGRLYGAEIRWERVRDDAWPRHWRYETRAPLAARGAPLAPVAAR